MTGFLFQVFSKAGHVQVEIGSRHFQVEISNVTGSEETRLPFSVGGWRLRHAALQMRRCKHIQCSSGKIAKTNQCISHVRSLDDVACVKRTKARALEGRIRVKLRELRDERAPATTVAEKRDLELLGNTSLLARTMAMLRRGYFLP